MKKIVLTMALLNHGSIQAKSLYEIANEASHSSHAIKKEKANSQVMESRVTDAKSSLFPRLSVQTEGTKPVQKDLSTEYRQRTVSSRIRLEQPLYDAASFNLINKQSIDLDRSQNREIITHQRILSDVSLQYLDCARMVSELEVPRDIRADLEVEKSSVEKRIELGIATAIDLMNIDLQIEQWSMEESRLDSEIQSSLIQIASLSNTDIGSCDLGVKTGYSKQISLLPFPSNKDLRDRPSLKDQIFEKELAQEEKRLNYRSLLPRFYVFADKQHSIFGDEQSEQNDIGMGLTWTLSGNSITGPASASRQIAATEIQIQENISMSKLAIEQKEKELRAAAAMSLSFQSAIEKNRELLAAQTKLHKLGQQDFLEVLRTRRNLSALRRRHVQLEFGVLALYIQYLQTREVTSLEHIRNLSLEGVLSI